MLTDQDEISNLYRGPSIDASYQVSVQLAKQFQRRGFLEIHQSETRNTIELPVVVMFVNESGQTEQSLYMLSTKFQSIWENGFRGEDFLEINQSEKRMACGGHV